MQKSGTVISRRRVVTAALLAVPLASLSRLIGSDEGSVQAADVSVNIMNFKFDPTPLTIPVGTTVVWTNQDTAPHNATSDPGSAFTFATSLLQKGQSDKVTFTTPGTFTYYCTVHPNMHGTVVVTAGGAAPAAVSAPITTAPSVAAPSVAAPSVAAPPAGNPPAVTGPSGSGAGSGSGPTGSSGSSPTTSTSGPPGALPAYFIRRLGDG